MALINGHFKVLSHVCGMKVKNVEMCLKYFGADGGMGWELLQVVQRNEILGCNQAGQYPSKAQVRNTFLLIKFNENMGQ